MVISSDLDLFPAHRPDLRLVFKSEHNRGLPYRHDPQSLPFPEEIPLYADDDYRLDCQTIFRTMEDVRSGKKGNPQVLEPQGLDHIETIFPKGGLFCLLALPFRDDGYHSGNLSQEDWMHYVQNGGCLKKLWVELVPVKSPQNNSHKFIPGLTYGFDDLPGYFFHFLSPSIQKDISKGGCTFKLDYPGENTFVNQRWFLENYHRALQNLFQLLSPTNP